MVIIDFHKHAQKRAAQPQSVSSADTVLAISIRRTTLFMGFKRPSENIAGALKVAPNLLFTHC